MMPFGEQELRDGQKFDWDNHYEVVIQETVRRAGMVPLRADEIYGAKPLLQRLWQGIQEAEVIIADLTGRSPNVLYELGLAHVIGKRILVLTMYPDDVPVDLGEFVQIRYSKEGVALVQFMIELQRNLEAARRESPAEAMLIPLPYGGIEEIPATVLSVMPEFAMIKARDGRIGLLSAEDFAWTKKPRDLTRERDLQVGRELKGAFIVDSNGQQKYSLTFGDNPWPKLAKEFPVGSVFPGTVVNVREGTGAWVNMNYGIHGFIPQGQHPRDLMTGSTIKARVVEINEANRQVKLQFVEKILGEQGKSDPSWPFRRGQKFEGRIDRTVPEKGFALVKIDHEEQPVTGMLHRTRMTPLLRDRLLNQDLRVGDPLAVEVVDVDPVNRRLSFRDLPPPGAPVPEPQVEMLQAY